MSTSRRFGIGSRIDVTGFAVRVSSIRIAVLMIARKVRVTQVAVVWPLPFRSWSYISRTSARERSATARFLKRAR